jgi:hypothetical protein
MMSTRNRKLLGLFSVTTVVLVIAWLALVPPVQQSDFFETGSPQESVAHDDPVSETKSSPVAIDDTTPEPPSREEDQPLSNISRYPATTRRIGKNSHDLLNPGSRYERRQRLPNDPDNPDPGWNALFTADRYFIHGDEVATISLDLKRNDTVVVPQIMEMRAEAIGARFEPKTIKLPVYGSNGGALIYFIPDLSWPDFSGPIRVTTRFKARNLMTQTGTLDFHFTGSDRIPAEFTGQFQDLLEQGDLVFDIGVKVLKAGRFRIEANLFDVDGRPFGWARFEGHLASGLQTIALRYDGLLFHDSGALAPYRLAQLRGYRLEPESRWGRANIPPAEYEYLTSRSYQLAQFHNTLRISPRQQRMADMYEDARKRGVLFTRPPPAHSSD